MKPKKTETLVRCSDCAHSYDYHEFTAYDPRVPFMCRCPYREWSQFLDIPQICEHYKKR